MRNAATLMVNMRRSAVRALLVNLMFVGFPMGSSLGGFLSAWMIPALWLVGVLVLGVIPPAGSGVSIPAAKSVRYSLVVEAAPAQRIACYPCRHIAPLPKAVEFTTRSRPGEREIRYRRHFSPSRYAVVP